MSAALHRTVLISSLLSGLVSASAFAASPSVLAKAGSCQSINDALNQLPVSGGTITLEAGTYICDSPVIINRDNITVVGAGRGKTIIKTADGNAMPTVIIGEAVGMKLDDRNIPYPDRTTSNVTLSGVTIDGNFHKHADPGNFECYDPRPDAQVKSLNCGKDTGHFIRNNGLTIRASKHVRVYDLETRGGFSGGIVLEKRNDDIVMDGFTTLDNWYDGFAGYETSNSAFRNFSANSNQYSGVSVDAAFDGNTFENGEASNNGDNGIFSADVQGNTYINLRVMNNSNLGFYIDGMRDENKQMIPHTCDGNRVINTTISGQKAGISVNHMCLGTVIQNVKIAQPQLACTNFNSAAKIAISGSSCSNLKQTISIDGLSQN